MKTLPIKSIGVVFAAFALFVCFAVQNSRAATYTVTTTADTGAGSLRQAVADANANAADDTVVFNIPAASCSATTGVCTITLASEIAVSNNGALTINGTGANRLTIDGGTGGNRIFYLAGATFTLRGATLTDGNGFSINATNYGGAILVQGGTTLFSGVYFLNNTARNGGAINYFGGTNRIENSAFAGNQSGAQNLGGGAISLSGNLTVVNSTFNGNAAANIGGAIKVETNSTLTLLNATLAGNRADTNGGAPGSGGGVHNRGTFVINNSIIAGNSAAVAGAEIFNSGTVTSNGYNLIGDSAGDSADTNAAITYQSTDILDTPPLLDALGNYGGSIPTMRLQATSPAIDKGSAVAGITTDARGVMRPFDDPAIPNAPGGNGADIGAFELQTSIIKEWGLNFSGQLGLGNTTSQFTTPQTLTGLNNITQFGGGCSHSVVLLADGTVRTSGDNQYGQQGIGTVSSAGNRSTYGAVTGANVANITQVSDGCSHSLALRSDGTVWAWGLGDSGQLGNGANANSGTPVQVGAGIAAFNTHVIAVSSSFATNLALTDDGKVWAWGYNGNGQLGDGTTTNSNVPIPVKVSSGGVQLSGIIQIGVGDLHGIALKSDGTVVAWGGNGSGQVGNGTSGANVPYPTQTTNTLMGTVVQISAGVGHSVAVNTAGDVYAWGSGGNGQIGDNNTANALAPRKASTVANVVRVEARYAFHTLARQRDGTLYAWGTNFYGQIGNGTPTQQNTPLNISAIAGTGGNLGTNIAVFGVGPYNTFTVSVPEAATPAGASVMRGDQFSVAFPASTVAGTTQVRTIDPTATGAIVPATYTILANSTGYDIASTASLAGGAATVCLKVLNLINQNDFNRLYILHDDDGDGALDAVNGSRNYQKREICRQTASFSPFVIALAQFAPTAAAVSISGRVTTPHSLGLTNALVTLTDADGDSQTVSTGKSGAFRFTEVAAGKTYVLSVRSKRYHFAPQIVTTNEDLTDVNFTAH